MEELWQGGTMQPKRGRPLELLAMIAGTTCAGSFRRSAKT